MKVRTFKNPANNRYYVDIHTEDFSENDRKKMDMFGEPEVNVGGTYGDPESTSTSGWVLPDNFKRINSDFKPLRGIFDARDYDDAEERADEWADVVKERVEEAVTTLRAQQDTFTEESVDNI